MLRISVTDLESWRYYQDLEHLTLDDLLKSLAHVDPPSRKMLAGRALAKFFEAGREGDHESAIVDGWTFNFNLDDELVTPPLREHKIEREMFTPSGRVTLVGKLDGFDRFECRDQKLTESIDAERYIDSLQWRAYLCMTGACRFVYDVFQGCIADTKDEVSITAYKPFAFWRYPDIGGDVRRAVCELAEVLVKHGSEIEGMKNAKKG